MFSFDGIDDLIPVDKTAYYVVWYIHGHLYYLYDATADSKCIAWTKSKADAIRFLSERDANFHAIAFNDAGRCGVAVLKPHQDKLKVKELAFRTP